MNTKPWHRALLLAGTALLSTLGFHANAEEETITVLAPWEAEGKMYKIGPQRVQFVGAFEGIMYIEAGAGELDAALFVCPTVHELNLETEETRADGHCHIVDAGGNVYGQFSCQGKLGYCDGRFEITAGTDDFEGITGAGPMKIRTALTTTMRDSTSGALVSEAAGLAVWPNFKISIPEKPASSE
jgi:hypothetical protein